MVITCFLLTFTVNLNAVAASPIKIYVYEDLLTLSTQPILKGSNIMIPLKNVTDALGLKYSWDSKSKKAIVKNDKYTISIVVGNTKGYVNSKQKTLELAPSLVKNTVMVPYKFIPQAIGVSVKWDSLNSRILIGKSELSSDVHMSYADTVVHINNLYTVNGTGKYKGFRQLKGYPYESKFSIYFKESNESKGQIVSFETATVDKANLNQIVTWKYKGKSYRNKRSEIYNFFSGVSKLSSLVNDGSYSLDWMSKTFGKVYDDWMFYQTVSGDASNIVEAFIDEERGITNSFKTEPIPEPSHDVPTRQPGDLDGITEYSETPEDNSSSNGNNSLAKSDFDINYAKFREQWISEDDLKDEYNVYTWWNGNTIELSQRITELRYIIDNSPSSSFEPGKVYQSSGGIQFQYVKNYEYGGHSVALNEIVFDRKALQTALEGNGFKKLPH